MTSSTNAILTPMSASINAISGKEGYKNLVRLVARAMYRGPCPPPEPTEGPEPRLKNKAQKACTFGC